MTPEQPTVGTVANSKSADNANAPSFDCRVDFMRFSLSCCAPGRGLLGWGCAGRCAVQVNHGGNRGSESVSHELVPSGPRPVDMPGGEFVLEAGYDGPDGGARSRYEQRIAAN